MLYKIKSWGNRSCLQPDLQTRFSELFCNMFSFAVYLIFSLVPKNILNLRIKTEPSWNSDYFQNSYPVNKLKLQQNRCYIYYNLYEEFLCIFAYELPMFGNEIFGNIKKRCNILNEKSPNIWILLNYFMFEKQNNMYNPLRRIINIPAQMFKS